MKKLLSQRGAMFGLDARIAMAIIGALSLVGGATMFMTSSETKAKALVADLQAYKVAIQAMEYDLKTRLTAAVSTPSDTSAVIKALNDVSQLSAAHQIKWLGPYIKKRSADITNHEHYGTFFLVNSTAGNPTTGCTGTAICNHWIALNGVPYNDFLVANQIIDGTETTPESEGRLWWVSSFTGFGNNILVYSAGKRL